MKIPRFVSRFVVPMLAFVLALAGQTFPATAQPSGGSPLIFLPPATFDSGGWSPRSVALADLNGDGKPDLVVANECSLDYPNCVEGGIGSVAVLMGNGDGTFAAPVTYNSGGYEASSVAIADMNGDGKPDIIVANACTSNPNCEIGGNGRVDVLLNLGNGTFNPALSIDTGAWVALSVAVADVNGDGKPDAIVAHNCASPTTCQNGGVVSVLLGKGDGTFQPAVIYSTGGQEGIAVAIGDVNGDHKPDLAVVNSCQIFNNCGAGGSVNVLLGHGDGTFQAPVSYNTGGAFASSVSIAYVNGDNQPDLIISNGGCNSACTFDSGVVSVLLGKGDGTFKAAVPYSSGAPEAVSAIVGDVNGDGRVDLIVGNCVCGLGVGSMGLLMGNGNGTFQPAVNYALPGNDPVSLGLGDVNGDGRPDLLMTIAGSAGVLLNNGGAPPTTNTLLASVNPVNLKQGITYTATVSGPGGSLSGSVVFLDSGKLVSTVTLTDNQAVYATTYSLKSDVGLHTITASYSGAYQVAEGSQSAPIAEYVRTAATKTVLTTSGSPSTFGQQVTFTATVTANPKYGLRPDGELVIFYDGSAVLASVPLVGGKAIYTTSTLSVKAHHIKSNYPGDTKFKPSGAHILQIVQ
jgi:hypothetical protein